MSDAPNDRDKPQDEAAPKAADDAVESASPPAIPEASASASANDPASERSEGEANSKTGEKTGAQATASPAEKGPPLIARGNPLRYVRGGGTMLLGALLAFLLMAKNSQMRFGVPLGLLCCLVATWGALDLLGSFDDAEEHVAERTSLAALAAPIGGFIGSIVLFFGSIAVAAGPIRLPQLVFGLVVTLTFVLMAAALFRLGTALGVFRTDESGSPRPLFRRHGFWVVTFGAALYFPCMGSFSLWDPWETHYGEVAREILARDDWISLWWAQDGWFWSKPILNFWVQSLSMASLGAHYQPDKFLIGAGSAPDLHPEWIVRTPIVLMTILAMYILYKGVSRAFGRRAALIGAIVLGSMPDWYFLAHQTMTDMPMVASMTSAMGLLLLGVHASEDQRVKLYEVSIGKRLYRLSGFHLVFGAVLACAIPQILYLFSRNLELVITGPGQHGFRHHWDEFRSGSGMGNCGLPGNEACAQTASASIPKSLGPNVTGFGNILLRAFGAFEPFVQAIVWTAVLGTALYINWGERRLRRLYYLAAWFFAAIATMGKGPVGCVIPMICAFAYVCTKKRWAELTRLELVSGVLIILSVALPWYVAMYVRHGSPFTDRLIFHDMFNRALHHVHDTNEGDDTSFRFYIWQLGYGFFPWTGLVPLGLLYWMRRSDSADNLKGDTSIMLLMWFVFSFALFSFMGTKFHHYIAPAVPPAAMLSGIVVDAMLGEKPLAKRGSLPLYLGGIGAAIAMIIFGVHRFWPGSIIGTRGLKGEITDPSMGTAIIVATLGVALLVAAVSMFRGQADDSADKAQTSKAPYRGETPLEQGKATASPSSAAPTSALEIRSAHESLMLGGGAVGAALVLALVGRDLGMKADGAEMTGAIRLLQLFTYNYKRPWPESLDFTAIISAFAVVAVLLTLLLTVSSIRRHIAVAFCALGALWGVWGIDVYMTKTAPHWGQHEVIEAYYRDRQSPNDQLVAYQMNWKGENIYSGNRIPAFVSSGATFTNWLKKEREKGAKVMYFVTEHSRVGGLKSEVGGKNYRELTDKVVCNKFVLVRADL